MLCSYTLTPEFEFLFKSDVGVLLTNEQRGSLASRVRGLPATARGSDHVKIGWLCAKVFSQRLESPPFFYIFHGDVGLHFCRFLTLSQQLVIAWTTISTILTFMATSSSSS